MFKSFKDKLKGWFTTSKESIEEDIEPTETEEKIEEEIPKEPIEEEHQEEPREEPKKETKEELISKETEEELSEEQLAEKADKLIEDTKNQESKPLLSKFSLGKLKSEPDLEKIKEKDIEKLDKKIEEAKQEPTETPVQFHAGKKQYIPDTEKITEQTEKLKQETDSAKKLHKEIKEVEENILKKPEQEIEEPILKEPPLEETTPEEPTPAETPEKKSFFSKITSSLSYKISEEEFTKIYDDLEMLLLENNVALEVVEDLKTKLAEKLIGKEIKKDQLEQTIKTQLKNSLNELIIEPDNPLELIRIASKPFTILFFGVNGTGKTTSISKIASFLKQAGHSTVLAAGDTFRAASIEQLTHHANSLNIPIIKHDYNSDPAAVGFDAIKYAKANNIDVVLIDTAGRMHTKANLIEEMKKIERVTKPNLKIFVAESIAGNDAVEQAKTFHEAIEIDGSILSKADIDEKGGTIISVSHATNKPIFYLGTGQNYEDIELFNKQKFIESLGL
ncbi:signal recognition particle-docking protein FtsY [Candidatus Pacearchaeota archaeon]|jgi:fused signal recognition particle receptor|nr:signal recognition particle-docking protein FtsY [Candidatus Pacearchaeota archaeon]|tara:strand:+ start:1354 stop:2868 length:1515 start_codon:yes stop_codon:yes gene_type:complete